MPLYEYQCLSCAHRFERIQKFTDPLPDACPICGSAVRKLMSSPAIQFKGSGFYITDYAKKGPADAGKGGSPTEGAKGEGSKSEGAGGESSKSDGAKSEGAKSEGSKSEGAKSESSKSDAPGGKSESSSSTAPTTASRSESKTDSK